MLRETDQHLHARRDGHVAWLLAYSFGAERGWRAAECPFGGSSRGSAARLGAGRAERLQWVLLMNVRAASATSCQPLSKTREWPRPGISWIWVAEGLRFCFL
jgi:hypothetical protein